MMMGLEAEQSFQESKKKQLIKEKPVNIIWIIIIILTHMATSKLQYLFKTTDIERDILTIINWLCLSLPFMDIHAYAL